MEILFNHNFLYFPLTNVFFVQKNKHDLHVLLAVF